MTVEALAAIAYGILAIVGGVIGYKAAGSQPSLISGAISGALLIIGGIAELAGQAWGQILVAIVAAVLVVVFAVRLAKTRRLMPAGLMLAAGVAVLVLMTA
ncbi:MAG: TMEM14 family protein [Cyanobacteria bacterium P01_A01_bin.135]